MMGILDSLLSCLAVLWRPIVLIQKLTFIKFKFLNLLFYFEILTLFHI